MSPSPLKTRERLSEVRYEICGLQLQRALPAHFRVTLLPEAPVLREVFA